MKNKKKKPQNSNGITICDSIVMSVRHRRPNVRSFEAVCIALIGYVSVIMSFLNMFSFKYDASKLFFACLTFSAVYIYASLCGRNGSYFTMGSAILGMVLCYRNVPKLAMGYKFMYNTIYHVAFRTEITYYKFLRPELEKEAVTSFFILCAWLIAIVLYHFTISRPNYVLPLLVTFPVIEIGLYNGIEMPVFWGVMVVAYWLALMAMSNTDVGEYSGGNGGFVRKDNLFFPKRQMRLKVTEKCGVIVILAVVCSGALASGFIRLSHYKRSAEMNKKRIEIRDAVSSFSVDNLAESVADLTSAFGLDFKYENHHLGNVDRLRYKDTTDLTVVIDGNCGGAVYLKDYTGSVYLNNEWTDLPETLLSDPLMDDFNRYKSHPQRFPADFMPFLVPDSSPFKMTINSELKGKRSFAPYAACEDSALRYTGDTWYSSAGSTDLPFSYSFYPVNNDIIAGALSSPQRNVFYLSSITDTDCLSDITNFCLERDILSYDSYFSVDSEIPVPVDSLYERPETIIDQLMQADYKEFVYKNYLTVPDDTNMDEVYSAYKSVLELPDYDASSRLEKLTAIRDMMTSQVTYSLTPGRTPSNRDFVNYFLLENKKGYCTHYATSGVILARMAGIPARYATGYVIVGDDFNNDNLNSDGTYTIPVKDNRSHAWSEVYLDGFGWVPFEFTAGYSSQTINTEPPEEETTQPPTEDSTEISETTSPSATSASTNATDNTDTTSAANKTTEAPGETTMLTTSAGAGIGNGDSGSGERTPIELPTPVKNVIRTIVFLAGIVAFILIRRWFRLRIRRMHFTTGTNSSRISYIYDYAESLLKTKGKEKGDMTYADFASEIDLIYGGRYFDTGNFTRFVDTALRAGFDRGEPDADELRTARRFAEDLADKFYQERGWFSRLIMKYITTLK